MQKIERLFDFFSDKSNILIHKSKADVYINNKTYSGNGEVKLELLPNGRPESYANLSLDCTSNKGVNQWNVFFAGQRLRRLNRL